LFYFNADRRDVRNTLNGIQENAMASVYRMVYLLYCDQFTRGYAGVCIGEEAFRDAFNNATTNLTVPDETAMSTTSNMDVSVPSAINQPDEPAMSITSSMAVSVPSDVTTASMIVE
jgi:hypothetical protein